MASKFIMKNCSVLLCILVSAALLTIAGKPIGQAVMWYHEVKAQGVNSSNQNMSAAAATNNGGIANNNNIQNITGSIQLRNIIGSAISSQIKVSLIQAIMA